MCQKMSIGQWSMAMFHRRNGVNCVKFRSFFPQSGIKTSHFDLNARNGGGKKTIGDMRCCTVFRKTTIESLVCKMFRFYLFVRQFPFVFLHFSLDAHTRHLSRNLKLFRSISVALSFSLTKHSIAKK